MNVAYVVDWFPELSETWVTGELRELRALGHDVRVEFGAHAARPDPSAAAGIEAHCMCDDTLGERVRSLVWLVARHPLRCARDLAARRRWRREEDVRGLRTLAPAVRRVHRSGARHLHAHFAAGAALDALRTGALLGLPYSVMTHGYDLFSEPRNLREKHERAAFALTPCDYSAPLPARAPRRDRPQADRRRRPRPLPPLGARIPAGARSSRSAGSSRRRGSSTSSRRRRERVSTGW